MCNLSLRTRDFISDSDVKDANCFVLGRISEVNSGNCESCGASIGE